MAVMTQGEEMTNTYRHNRKLPEHRIEVLTDAHRCSYYGCKTAAEIATGRTFGDLVKLGLAVSVLPVGEKAEFVIVEMLGSSLIKVIGVTGNEEAAVAWARGASSSYGCSHNGWVWNEQREYTAYKKELSYLD